MTYKSLIDQHECTEPHYLTEFVAIRKAAKEDYPLPPKFWRLDQFKKEYHKQIIAANSLLKLFCITDILEGLRCKKGNWIYSLANRTLIDVISEIKTKQDSITKAAKIIKEEFIPPSENPTITSKPAKPIAKKTLFDQLDDKDTNVVF